MAPAKRSRVSARTSMVVAKKAQSKQVGVAPPEKKSKESSTISIVVEEWKNGQTEQFSAVHRINGYPWRLRLCEGEESGEGDEDDEDDEEHEDWGDREIKLICDKSNEADLWMCTATFKPLFNDFTDDETHSFNSWNKASQSVGVRVGRYGNNDHDDRDNWDKLTTVGTVLEVEIELDTDGEKWNHPILDPLEPLDGILVIKEKKKKPKTINVNKASLAAQSTFFNNLFFGNSQGMNMAEISIEDVEYEEFSNLLKIIYRHDGRSLTDKNVCRVLQLAIRFDLKIVENVCVNYLLSSSSLSIHKKLLISEENNLSLLKEQIIERYTNRHLEKLVDSPEWEVLSKETTKALMKKCLGIVRSRDSQFDKMVDKMEWNMINRRR